MPVLWKQRASASVTGTFSENRLWSHFSEGALPETLEAVKGHWIGEQAILGFMVLCFYYEAASYIPMDLSFFLVVIHVPFLYVGAASSSVTGTLAPGCIIAFPLQGFQGVLPVVTDSLSSRNWVMFQKPNSQGSPKRVMQTGLALELKLGRFRVRLSRTFWCQEQIQRICPQ